jgi:hypothetical protein
MLFLVYNKEFSVYFLLAHNRVSSSTLHKMWKRVKFTSDSDGNQDDINKTLCIKTNVIKTGPDRPVRPVGPGTGHSTGPGGSWNRAVPGTGQKSFKTVVNRIEPAEPVNR